MRDPLDEILLFEAVDGVGDARGMYLQPGADLVERERALPRKDQEHEDLVAREGQFQRPQHCVDAGQEHLLSAGRQT